MTPNVRHPTSGLSPIRQSGSVQGPPPFTGQPWDLGTVESYDPATRRYFVQMDSGGAPVFLTRVVDHPGETSVLPQGARVVVCSVLPRGQYIFGCLEGNDPTLGVAATPWESGTNPGDHVMRSMGGGTVGVLASGTAVLSSGPGMGVFVNGIKERTDLITNELEESTAAGRRGVATTTAGANAYWRMGIGAVQPEIVYLDVGATGDIIDLRVISPVSGGNVARFHVSPNGQVDLEADAGFSRVIKGQEAVNISGDRVTSVSGTDTLSVVGARTEEFGSVSRASGPASEAVVGNHTSVVSGDRNSQTVGATRHIGLSKARFEYGDNIEWVVGDPRNLKFTPGAVQALINYVGDTHVVSVLPGKSFNVVTTGPGTVNLGVPGVAVPNPLGGHIITAAPGVFSVTKYEPLAALIQTLLTWMDTHVHTSLGVPPTVPSTPIVSPLVAALQSQTVKVGPL